ncbi:hypothetical protein BJY52DRAFT_1222956 [Lactarius psammicola]|nr:hypothetical protein BJY52DRAFT_1222956 [Lactarius psammicola]
MSLRLPFLPLAAALRSPHTDHPLHPTPPTFTRTTDGNQWLRLRPLLHGGKDNKHETAMKAYFDLPARHVNSALHCPARYLRLGVAPARVFATTAGPLMRAEDEYEAKKLGPVPCGIREATAQEDRAKKQPAEQKKDPCGSDRGHEERSHSLARQRGIGGGSRGLGPHARVREALARAEGRREAGADRGDRGAGTRTVRCSRFGVDLRRDQKRLAVLYDTRYANTAN